MATIQLNLELTDEQYKQLMDSSLERVLTTDDTVAALQNIITAQMGEYLIKNTDIIRKMFYDHNAAYGWEIGPNPVTKAIVTQAASDVAKKIEEAVSGYLMDLMKTQDIAAVLNKIFTAALLQGAVSGLDRWRDEIQHDVDVTTFNIKNIERRLGLSD